MGHATTGTYEVLNDFPLFTNDENGHQSYVPWERKTADSYEPGSLKLDLTSGLKGDNG